MSESWLDIPGYEGRYQVSDAGCIRALSFMQRYLKRNGAEAYRRTKPRILAQQAINSGYSIVHLHLDNKRTALLVHRLVAEVFCPGADKGLDVNHRNGIKSDNRAENLEWLTRTNNQLHAVSIGLNATAVPVIDPATGTRYASIRQAARGARTSHRKVAATFTRGVPCPR